MASYESPLRRDQAAATRLRIVAAAARCFSERGYAATTLRVIARQAGVSVETVQAAGPKRVLLVAAFNLLFTDDPAEQEFRDRPAIAEIMNGSDGAEVLCRLGRWLADSNANVADLWQVLAASATDEPEVANYLNGLHRRTRQQATRVVSELADRGLINPPRSASRTADLLWNAQTPDSYLRLVRHAGWSQRAYAQYLFDTLAVLCRPVPSAG